MGAGDWKERSERKPQSLSWDVIHEKEKKEEMSHIGSVKAIQCDDCMVKISIGGASKCFIGQGLLLPNLVT